MMIPKRWLLTLIFAYFDLFYYFFQWLKIYIAASVKLCHTVSPYYHRVISFITKKIVSTHNKLFYTADLLPLCDILT